MRGADFVVTSSAGEADASNIKLARTKLQEWRANLPVDLTVNASDLPPVCPPAHIVNMKCVVLHPTPSQVREC